LCAERGFRPDAASSSDIVSSYASPGKAKPPDRHRCQVGNSGKSTRGFWPGRIGEGQLKNWHWIAGLVGAGMVSVLLMSVSFELIRIRWQRSKGEK